MCDPNLRHRIEEALEELDKLRGSCPPLPVNDWELVLELGEDDETGEHICSYYYACPSVRCLFWLHEFDPGSALAGLRGVAEWPHVRESLCLNLGVSSAKLRADLALQAQYW